MNIFQTIWPALVWAIFVLGLSIMPGPELPPKYAIPHLDKVVHFLFYAIFSALLFFFFKTRYQPLLKVAVLVFVLSSGYGWGIELIQGSLISNRTFDAWDGLSNMTGALAFLLTRIGQAKSP